MQTFLTSTSPGAGSGTSTVANAKQSWAGSPCGRRARRISRLLVVMRQAYCAGRVASSCLFHAHHCGATGELVALATGVAEATLSVLIKIDPSFPVVMSFTSTRTAAGRGPGTVIACFTPPPATIASYCCGVRLKLTG